VTAVLVGVVVLQAVVVLLLLTGTNAEHSREGETITAKGTALSSSGRSLCIERAGNDDTCGVPVVLPGSTGQLTPGSTITVTELWLTTNDITSLTWMVH
jgi:hypothetical protein